MTIVVSDTNVFIALFRASLLCKVFARDRVELLIPKEIYNELTLQVHRTHREYPQLSSLIIDCVHNPNHNHGIKLTVCNIQEALEDPDAIRAHFQLEDDAVLDAGEREAIPLAIEYSAVFLSCDSQAIDEYFNIENKNNSTAENFINYCENMKNNGVITTADYQNLLQIIRS